MPAWLLVACGGFLGSALRYGVSGLAGRIAPASPFPFGTLTVNVLGSLLIGLLAGLSEGRGFPGPQWRLLLVVGLLGGFTTFSAFSLETLELYRSGRPLLALGNVLGNNLLGILAACCGYFLTRLPRLI